MIIKNVLKLLLVSLLFTTGTNTYASTSISSVFIKGLDQEEPAEPGKRDKQGKKQGLWIYLGKHVSPSKGYPLDGKVKEGEYKNDRKEGVWTTYFKDGATAKTKGNFANGRPSGSFKKFHSNGNLKEQGVFIFGKYQDSLTRYNAKGVKIYEANYGTNGNEEGKVVYYHDNGKPEFTYNSQEGKIEGTAYRYWPNGDVKEVIEYAGGVVVSAEKKEQVNAVETFEGPDPESGDVKLPPVPKGIENCNGYNKVLNNDQEVWMEGNFKKCKLWNGKLYIYDEDGLLEKLEVYKRGKYHSDGQL